MNEPTQIINMKPIESLGIVELRNGKFGYVGRIPASIAFVDATPEKIEAGRKFGERFGPKNRRFESYEAAEKFANDSGYKVEATTSQDG